MWKMCGLWSVTKYAVSLRDIAHIRISSMLPHYLGKFKSQICHELWMTKLKCIIFDRKWNTYWYVWMDVHISISVHSLQAQDHKT